MSYRQRELLRITPDGPMWCASFRGFINLAESPAGFGSTPFRAFLNLLWVCLPKRAPQEPTEPSLGSWFPFMRKDYYLYCSFFVERRTTNVHWSSSWTGRGPSEEWNEAYGISALAFVGFMQRKLTMPTRDNYRLRARQNVSRAMNDPGCSVYCTQPLTVPPADYPWVRWYLAGKLQIRAGQHPLHCGLHEVRSCTCGVGHDEPVLVGVPR